MDIGFFYSNQMVFVFVTIYFCTSACMPSKKYVAVDLMLKNYPIIQQYVNNPNYKVEFHDTDILLQRKNLGKKYTYMYLLSSTKTLYTIDSLTLFEIDNQNNKETIAFPRTPSPLTPLMNAYYSSHSPKVYANTTAEMLNYLDTGYAQKTWITALDTSLSNKKWVKKQLSQKIYLVRLS